MRSEPGKIVNFTATAAPTPKAAAEIYPAIYWYSMLKTPAKHEFPVGNVKSQAEWLNVIKTNGCFGCHALGNKATRTIPPMFADMKPEDAWARRILSGQAMTSMATAIGRIDTQRALKLFADWTDRDRRRRTARREAARGRRAASATSSSRSGTSPIPSTTCTTSPSTDKRKPTLNANGLIYGAVENSTDLIPVLDPVKHTASSFKMPVRDPKTHDRRRTIRCRRRPIGATRLIWDSQTTTHNPMYDEKGRVWCTSRVGPPPNPDFCKKGSSHPSAKVFPLDTSTRHLSMLDPKTGKITLIRTCYPTHHLVFAEDANNTLWLSAGGPGCGVLGWLDTQDVRGDRRRGQGAGLDADRPRHQRQRQARRLRRAEPAGSIRPRTSAWSARSTASASIRKDGTIWGSVLTFPGYVDPRRSGRQSVGDRARGNLRAADAGLRPARLRHRPRTASPGCRSSSGHMGKFDRSKCKVLQRARDRDRPALPGGLDALSVPRPAACGHRAEPAARRRATTPGSISSTRSGSARNVPWATGNANESLMALVDGQWLNFVVPYPLGFYAKWMDGRIDDPNAGWKGRGVWATYGTRTPFHLETGKGTRPKVVKFQLRPDPLAR